ncbi:MAG: FeoB-associated Cys-rich membrane protein [Bacteroidales bacterium]|nr:FeoB-associated Cys-rich membrane protein [Bacteroidales bacterium]
MTQTIIAYIIICAAVGYTIYSVVRKLRNNDKNSCSDCSCCAKKSGCKTKKY